VPVHAWRMVLSVVVAGLLGAALAAPAAAQDTDTDADDTFDFSQLEGVEEVVSRTYSADLTALIESVTPGADFDPSVLGGEGLFSLTAVVAKFDGDDNAEAGLEAIAGEFTAQADELTGGAELEEVDLGDLGDNRVGYQATVEQEDFAGRVAVLAVQQDEFLYAAIGTSFGADPVEPSTTAIEAMIEADEGDDVETDENGVHSGGLWDKLPRDGDESLGTLTAIGDEQLYPVEEETPEA
jgi:hypothetical protein